MRIPKQLRVGRKVYTIERVPMLRNGNVTGLVYYGQQTIKIARGSNHWQYTPTQQFNTFWHELTHAILKDMGSKLEADERFVTAFADRLTKAITTAKF